MTKKRVRLSGYIKSTFKYSDAEVAALIEELDLVPAFLITPTLIRQYRYELREQYSTKLYNKENVRMALEYTHEFLTSPEGKARVKHFQDLFVFTPENRNN